MIEGGMMRRAIAAAFAVMIGAAVSQFFYAGLVPPFPKFLVVATALASGMYLRSWREIALAAFLPAIAWQTYETWVLRAPMLFWMVGGLFLTAEVAAVLTAGRLTRLGAQRLTSEWRRWGRGYEIGGPFPLESTSSRIGFGADLASAAQALISQPSVPLVSLAVWLLPDGVIAWTLPGHHSLVLSLLGLAIMLATLFFQLGWYGAERVFFQRRLRDEPVAVRHLLGLVGPFIGRFFAVGLPFGIVLAGFYFTAFRVHRPVRGPMPGWFHVGAGLCLLGMDFALTFVTPALAYTTRSALRAMAPLCPLRALPALGAEPSPFDLPGRQLCCAVGDQVSPSLRLAARQRRDCRLLPSRAGQLQRERGRLHHRPGRPALNHHAHDADPSRTGMIGECPDRHERRHGAPRVARPQEAQRAFPRTDSWAVRVTDALSLEYQTPATVS